MIDINDAIYTPIAQAVRAAYPGATVDDSYARSPSGFPHVTIVEADNYMTARHLDTSDTERFATLMYEVNVYSNSTTGKKAECRAIIDLIDRMMYQRNFTRLSMTPVPNLEDSTIYRITARYRAETDGEKLYRI